MKHDAEALDTGIGQRRAQAVARAKRSAVAWWVAVAIAAAYVMAGVVLQLSGNVAVTAWLLLAFSLFGLVPGAVLATSAWLQARRSI